MSSILIVTHISPDLDAVSSVWILKRFDQHHFGEADVAFVPAGQTLSSERISQMGLEDYNVVHVDTGKGEFDHHTDELAMKPICAASLVYDYVVKLRPELSEDKALKRMVDHFISIDHFGEIEWPEPNHDRYIFQLSELLSGLKTIGFQDLDVVTFGMDALDATYANFKERVAAEEEMSSGTEFMSRWGKAFGIVSNNDEILKFAQKEGYQVVVRKDPDEGNVRIKAVPGKNIDLSPIYEKIIARDSEATWYLHPSNTMLLNGSKKAHQVASGLSLEEIITLLKE